MDLFGNSAKARVWVLERELEAALFRNGLLEAEFRLLRARIDAQKEDIDRLIKHNKELANRPVPTRSETPLWLSEDEEDIRHAKDMGVLSIAEAEDMLRELDFENESIIVYPLPDDASTALN